MGKEHFGEEFNKSIREMERTAEEEYRRFMKEMERIKERGEWYVRSNPKKAIGISMAAGIFIGAAALFMARKKCRCR